MTEYIKDTGLPTAIEREIEQKLLSEKTFAALLDKCARATMQHRFADAVRFRSEMNVYIRNYVIAARDRIGQEKAEAKSIQERMTYDDNMEFSIITDTIIIIADMLEYSIMDMNAILHKYEPERDILMFDKMNKLLSEVREHMRFMADKTALDFQTAFADTADDIRELVHNKVAKLVRKRQETLRQQLKNDNT